MAVIVSRVEVWGRDGVLKFARTRAQSVHELNNHGKLTEVVSSATTTQQLLSAPPTTYDVTYLPSFPPHPSQP